MKVLKGVFKGFSIKKYLLSILCSIIFSNFICFTIQFIESSHSYINNEMMMQVYKNSEYVTEYGESLRQWWHEAENMFSEDREQYGSEYPAEGIFIQQVINVFRDETICKTYALSFLIGIILGSVIYIIFVKKSNSLQIIVELVLMGITIVLILELINVGYNLLVNYILNKNEIVLVNDDYITQIYDFDAETIINGFLQILGVSYVVNFAYQFYLSKKFNKKLNKK